MVLLPKDHAEQWRHYETEYFLMEPSLYKQQLPLPCSRTGRPALLSAFLLPVQLGGLILGVSTPLQARDRVSALMALMSFVAFTWVP